MRRAPWFITALFLAAAPTSALSYTMLLPGGGETWTAGTTHTVEWSGGLAGNVNLYLYSVTPFQLAGSIALGTPNDGAHSWTIPTTLPAGSYGVYIENTSRTDWHYGPAFTLNAAPACDANCQLVSVAMPYYEPPAGVCGQTQAEAAGYAQAWAQANFACPEGYLLSQSLVVDVSFLPVGVCLSGYSGPVVAEASALGCCCPGPTPATRATWGRIKTIYR